MALYLLARCRLFKPDRHNLRYLVLPAALRDVYFEKYCAPTLHAQVMACGDVYVDSQHVQWLLPFEYQNLIMLLEERVKNCKRKRLTKNEIIGRKILWSLKNPSSSGYREAVRA